MVATNPSADVSADELKENIHTYLVGKAYIAVMKHHLANGTKSGRRLKDVFDEAYHEASALAHCEASEILSPKEKVHTFVLGKAYIAVLKHQLAHGAASGRPLKDVFDEAYREAAALAKCEASETLATAQAKSPSS